MQEQRQKEKELREKKELKQENAIKRGGNRNKAQPSSKILNKQRAQSKKDDSKMSNYKETE